MIKRVFAFLLSVVLIVSAMSLTVYPVGFPENNTWETSEWITDSQVELLNKLGITSWTSISAMGARNEEVVTRWFVAFYVARIMKLDTKTPAEFETLFKDLTSEHTYYPQIKACVEAGYMKGDPDGFFRPDEPVTTAEVETIFLRVLGYSQYMSVVGEAKVRNMTKITDGIPASDSITQPQMLRMIYNALNSPVIRAEDFKKYSDGGIDINYVIDETYLGFEHFYDVKYEVAVLDGIQGTTLLNGTDAFGDGEISIAGIKYNYEGDATDLLGYRVNYFYKEVSDGEFNIIQIEKSDKNKELVLTHDMIDSFGSGVYTYYDGNKTKTAEITSLTRVIYNDIANPMYEPSEMIPEYGTVTLIDNDGKRGYEVVKIEDYDFYFVSSVNATENRIYDTESVQFDSEGNVVANMPLDLNCDNLTIMNGSSKINLDRVRKSNLLVVKRSGKNASYDKIYIDLYKVSAKGVKVTSVNEDYLSTATKKYPVWKYVNNVEMGKMYNLYTFEDTVVMAIENTDAGPEYAYLLNMGIDGNELMHTTRFAFIDLDGNYAEYEGAEKITVDGNKLEEPTRMADALINAAMNYSNGYSEDYPMSQPVKVGLNSKGQVNYIDTYQYNQGIEEESTLQYIPESKGSTNSYNSYNRSLYNLAEGTTNQYTKFVTSMETSTPIIFVPSNRFDEASYVKKGMTNADTYTVDVVGRDPKIMVADAVFAYYNPKSGGIATETRTFIIADLYCELNAEGEKEFYVTGYYMKNKYVYTCEEDLYNKLSVGDVYFFEVDRNNKIITNKLVYAINDDFPARENRQAVESQTVAPAGSKGTIYGSLVHSAGSYIRVSQSIPSDDEGYDPDFKVGNFYIANAGIYKYSKVQGQPVVEMASLSTEPTYYIDPENPAIVLVNVNNGVNQVYIIEK